MKNISMPFFLEDVVRIKRHIKEAKIDALMTNLEWQEYINAVDRIVIMKILDA